VILAEPPRTPYDVNFQILGFPVRIHPLFWLVGFVLAFNGASHAENPGLATLVGMLVLFVSILVHELGHALMIRRFGRPAHIVLHWMGGLAIEGEDSPYSSFSQYSSSGFGRRRTPWEQILISFAGPGAGFIFAALVIMAVFATGGRVWLEPGERFVPQIAARLGGGLADNINLLLLVYFLLYFNIYWGLMNLLPVFPLDGGQIAQQIFVTRDPWGGAVRALWVSVLVGAATAVAALVIFKDTFVAILFASLAVSSYFTLQQMRGGGRPW
jgi:Zn-dependent protease